jgi:hypothetical protein
MHLSASSACLSATIELVLTRSYEMSELTTRAIEIWGEVVIDTLRGLREANSVGGELRDTDYADHSRLTSVEKAVNAEVHFRSDEANVAHRQALHMLP